MNAQQLTSQFRLWQSRSLLIAAVATLASIVGAVLNPAQFFHSYLFAWLFWAGLSLGTLVVLMLQALTGGKWGLAVRNLSLAGLRTVPWMALLFLPILLGLHKIYGWANGLNGEAPGYHHKAQYLNVPFFAARSILYLLILVALATAWRRRFDAAEKRSIVALSAGGLIVYVLCMNFASTDWVMSLDPKWYSTIFVEVFAVGQFLGGLALMTALLCSFTAGSSGERVPTKAFHDLGNMLLAFVIFWTYVSFSQFLIIWSGNLPKEISWYLDRSRGGWQWFALLLALAAFFLPFALLLARAAKRNRQALGVIAFLIVAANVLINFWLVAPSFHPHGIYVHWLDLAGWVALGGIWFALFFYHAKQRPLLPVTWMEEAAHG